MKYKRSVFTVLLAAALFGTGVSACAGGPPLPTYAMPPSNDVKTLTFLLSQPKAGDEIIASANDAIQSALIRAEYKITTDENDPHDAVIEIDISANEKQGGFMTVQVNGKTQRDYAIHVSLSVKDGGKIIDQKAYDYVASGGASETGNGFALINDLSGSPRFRTWAKEQVARSAPPKPSSSSTAIAAKSTAAPPPTTPPTSTSPTGALGTPPGPANTGGAAAGAASAGKAGAARDVLGSSGSGTAPAPSASAPTPPKGGTAPPDAY